MSSLTLCEDVLKVTVTAKDGRAHVQVVADGAIDLFCDIADLEGVLTGTPLQLSSAKGFCLFEATDGQVTLHFSIKGGSQKRCKFPSKNLEAAIKHLHKHVKQK